LRKAILLGLQMIGFILLYRLKTLGKSHRPRALEGTGDPNGLALADAAASREVVP
jgi:hypothetical protein